MLKKTIPPFWKSCSLLTVCLMLVLVPSVLLAKGNPEAKVGKPSEAVYETIVEYDVEIPMRDGTIMKADIYRPKSDGKFPVLIEGTPYGKQMSTDMSLGTHTFFVPRGYVFIAKDVRGRGNSGGEFQLHLNEQNDGYDTVEWAAKQAWSNGKIAAIGNSYGGQVALSTAISQPPHLVCAVPMLTSADLWRDGWYYRGGAMEFGFTSVWHGMVFGPELAKKNLKDQKMVDWFDNLALFMADMESFGTVVPAIDFEISKITPETNFFAEWASQPTDGTYYWQRNPETYFAEINVPILHIGGWADIFLNGTLKAYRDLQIKGASYLARENQRLFIGPWPHQGQDFDKQVIGVVDYGPNLLTPHINEVRLAFLDYWLKDTQHTTMLDENPVRIFVTGDNVWRTEDNWPLERAKSTNFYLNSDKSGTITSLNGDSSLSTDIPKSAKAKQSYIYDPMDPIPTRGGNTLMGFAYGPDGLPGSKQARQEQSPVDKKSLTFTSAPLDKDLELTGAVKAVIYASSSAVDTDWVVRINDIAPDGTSINIVDGIQRARFRSSGINPTLIEPNKIYEYEIDLYAVSHVFKPGHRIRVVVNSSCFPRWSRNMNVAAFPEQATEWVKAENTIYMNDQYPSHVVLPVVQR